MKKKGKKKTVSQGFLLLLLLFLIQQKNHVDPKSSLPSPYLSRNCLSASPQLSSHSWTLCSPVTSLLRIHGQQKLCLSILLICPRQAPFSWRAGGKVVPFESPWEAVCLKEGFPFHRDCPSLLWHLRTPKVPVEKAWRWNQLKPMPKTRRWVMLFYWLGVENTVPRAWENLKN